MLGRPVMPGRPTMPGRTGAPPFAGAPPMAGGTPGVPPGMSMLGGGEEGLPIGMGGGLPFSLESLKRDLEKVGRAIISSSAGEIAAERALVDQTGVR